VVGLLTAVHATMVWRVQTDVKSALAYAVLTQVGLMFAEVGLGWYRLALVHLVAHACLRCLQLLRAPSALREVQMRHAASQGVKPPAVAVAHHVLPEGLRQRFYRLALERFALDVLHEQWALRPLLWIGAWIDKAERMWVGVVSGWVPRSAEKSPVESEHRAAPGPSDGKSTGAV
jgi:hypothetical protein